MCIIFRSAYKWDNSKGMPAHVFYSNNYDALIASRKLDNTLMNFDVQECNMENQFKLVINNYNNLLYLKYNIILIIIYLNYRFDLTNYYFTYLL